MWTRHSPQRRPSELTDERLSAAREPRTAPNPIGVRLPVHVVRGPADRAAVTNTAECGDHIDRGAASRILGHPAHGIGVNAIAFITHRARTHFTADVRDRWGARRSLVSALLACARVIHVQYGYRSATIDVLGTPHAAEIGDRAVTLSPLTEPDGPASPPPAEAEAPLTADVRVLFSGQAFL